MSDNKEQEQESANDAVKGTKWGCVLISGGGLLFLGGSGLLFLVLFSAITGFQSMQDRAKEVAVRRNMGEIQKRVEQYSQRHKSYFPAYIDTSLSNGIAFENPYKLNRPFIVTMTDTITMTTTLVQGQIAYMPLDITNRGARRYGILGKSTQKNSLMKFRLYSQ
jgi:hypothetical protein